MIHVTNPCHSTYVMPNGHAYGLGLLDSSNWDGRQNNALP